MAYADRMTSEMGALATHWYEGVKTRILEKIPKDSKRLPKLLKNMEAPALDGFFQKGTRPMLSADYFRWSVARITWLEYFPDEPFPFAGEQPAFYGVPCSEQYVRYWYMRTKAANRMGGQRSTVSSSSSEVTTVEVREALAQRVRPDIMVVIQDCEPLSFPLPTVRKLDLCLGPKGDMKKTLTEAASIMGPEFTLSCSFGGNQPTIITFGLASGVDANDERVLSRARNPIDWLEDWWVNVLERDTNLVAHLQLLMRQRFMRPMDEKISRDRIEAARHALKYIEETGAKLSKEEVTMASKSQQQELDRLAEQLAHETVIKARDLGERATTLVHFVENGHPLIHVLDREDRLRVVQQSLVRKTATNFINRMVIDEKKLNRPLKDKLDDFIRIGSVGAPYLPQPAERLGIVEEALSSMDFRGVIQRREIRDLLQLWHDRLQRAE